MLTAPHLTLLHCNNFNSATLLPSITDEVLTTVLTLTDHLLTCNDVQEIPLGNVDFSWFIDGSYLKGDNDKYCAGYAITTPFDVVEAASLPMALTQQAELHALTQACTLAKDKTASVCTDNR